MKITFFSIILLFILLVVSCTACSLPLDEEVISEDVRIVTWNIQNLFDDINNGTEYDEYVPREKGWDSDLFHLRMGRIGEVFDALLEEPPQIILFQEIENLNTLQILNNTFLEKKYNNYMMSIVSSSLEECDLVVYVVDSTRPMGKEEQELIDMLIKKNRPYVIVLNKSDTDSKYTKDIRAFLLVNMKTNSIIETSALKKDGIDKLKDAIFEASPEGPQMYPEGFYTDQEPEFRIAEIIREKAITKMSQEIPHALYVEISDTEMKGEGEKQKLWVRAFLTVERESQKGMVIGKGGGFKNSIFKFVYSIFF